MIIALAGHVDHGKTALIRALTGIDADRLPEEKKRGMTIDLGFAHARMPSGATVGFVDVPGHERFLSNMLAGVLSIETVLLVIAADDGPMPQTREHLAILSLTGVTDITVVISKIDRVDNARLDAARSAARALLDGAGYAAAPVLEASSVTGDGIAAVLAHIEAKAAAHRARDASGGFRLAIDRSFSPAGAGLVVTGRCFGRRPVAAVAVAAGGAGARHSGAQRNRRRRAGRRSLRAGDLRSAHRTRETETRRFSDRSRFARADVADRRAVARDGGPRSETRGSRARSFRFREPDRARACAKRIRSGGRSNRRRDHRVG
jgi:selenocysteine-specific elongation factor